MRCGFYIDLSLCAGCQACTVACQNQNGLLPDQAFTRVLRHETGTFPDIKALFLVQCQCLHCEAPACTEVCPTGATYKTAEGPVLINGEDCIGCRYCATACPYNARIFDPETGKAEKCSLCFTARVQNGDVPACVATCLAGARQIGDLDNPEDPIHKLVMEPNVVHVAGTSFYFKLPPHFDRSVLPPDFKAPAFVYPWQSILQPLGQLMMGGAAAAVAVSMAAHGLKALRERGKGNDHHNS